MKNTRYYARYPVKCNGYVTDNNHHSYKFIMNNISAGGMSITTDKEVTDESTLTINLDISEILLPHTKQLKGTVVRKNTSNNGYHYGIHFFDLTKIEIVEMDEYLRFRHYKTLVHMIDNAEEDSHMSFSLTH